MKFKPRRGEFYWFIENNCTASLDECLNTEWDFEKFRAGNCFRTKKEAQQAAKLVKKCLMDFHKCKKN